MVALEYYVEQAILVVIGLTLLILNILLLIHERNQPEGTLGWLKIWFHRLGVTAAVFTCVRAIDPRGFYDLTDKVLLAGWATTNTTNILFAACCVVCHFSLKSYSDTIQKAPVAGLRIGLATLTLLTFFVGNGVQVLMLAFGKRWFFGLFLIWLANAFTVVIVTYVVVSQKLLNAIKDMLADTPNPKLQRAARDIRIFQIVGVCLILSAVPMQWISGLETMRDQNKSSHISDDPNHFDYRDIIFTVASMLGLFLLLWFSWLPGTVSRPLHLLSQLRGCGWCACWPCLDKNKLFIAPQGYAQLPSHLEPPSRSAALVSTHPLTIGSVAENGRTVSVSVGSLPASSAFSPVPGAVSQVSAPRSVAISASVCSPVDSLAATVTDKDPVIGSLPSVMVLQSDGSTPVA